MIVGGGAAIAIGTASLGVWAVRRAFKLGRAVAGAVLGAVRAIPAAALGLAAGACRIVAPIASGVARGVAAVARPIVRGAAAAVAGIGRAFANEVRAIRREACVIATAAGRLEAGIEHAVHDFVEEVVAAGAPVPPAGAPAPARPGASAPAAAPAAPSQPRNTLDGAVAHLPGPLPHATPGTAPARPLDAASTPGRARSVAGDIAFPAEQWTSRVTGQVLAGQGLRVTYDPGRLPALGATGDGWKVTGFYAFDGSPNWTAFDAALAGAGGHLEAVPVKLQVPEDAHQLQLWFEATRAGEEHFDSRFVENYRFDVASPRV